MSIAVAIVLTIISIFLSGFFSGSEIAFVQSSKVRMEIDAAKGGLVNRIIHNFSHHEETFISTLLVGNNVVLVIYGITFSVIINPFLEQWLSNEGLVLLCNTVCSTLVILITGEFIPKMVFRVNPNITMRLIALPLFLVYIILYPVSGFISWLSSKLMKMAGLGGEEDHSARLTMDELDDYIQTSIDLGSEKEDLENEVKIFRNAIDFKDTQIGDCMIPRNEIVAVDKNETDREKLVQLFMTTGLSKIVVYEDDLDDIIGYIHISEMLEPDTNWKERLKPVIFTPETMLADKMMRRMMSEKRSLAIVVDEFGGTAGLVTLEDLVEEIFGEIEDEHDRKRLFGRRISENRYELAGRAEISLVNEEFGLDIRESEDYHTIAGYILENLEALPTQGDTFDIGRLRFTIIRMSAARIELVGVEKLNVENT